MKKILMIYKRDGDKVLNEYIDEFKNYDKTKLKVSVKLDGTSCMWKNGHLYKRYDNKKNKKPEKDWIFCYKNDKHNIYWVPVTTKDKWHMEAVYDLLNGWKPEEATYELVGPKINGNKHHAHKHELVKHKELILDDITFAPVKTKHDWIDLMEYVDRTLPTVNIEGFVLWDIEKMEPMFKIRKRDLGVEF